MPLVFDPDEDLITGIVLPLLPSQAPDAKHEWLHFTRGEAAALSLTGLPSREDHDPKCDGVVGRVLTSAMRDDSPHKRVLLSIRPNTVNGVFASDKVATKEYKGLSLGHQVDFFVEASAHGGMPQRYYIKTPGEVSVCPEGWRNYSYIEHVFPCRKTLERLTARDLATFVREFGYEADAGAIERGAPGHGQYIDALCTAVQRKRDAVLVAQHLDREEVVTPLNAYPDRFARSRTTVCASMDAKMTDVTPPPQTAPPQTAPPVVTPAAAVQSSAPPAGDPLKDPAALLAMLKKTEEAREQALAMAKKFADENKGFKEAKEAEERAKAEAREKEKENALERLRNAVAAAMKMTNVLKPETLANIQNEFDEGATADPIGTERRVMRLIDVAASYAKDKEAWEKQAKELVEARTANEDRRFVRGELHSFQARAGSNDALAAELMANVVGAKQSLGERFAAGQISSSTTVLASAGNEKRQRTEEPAARTATATATAPPPVQSMLVEASSGRGIVVPAGQSAAGGEVSVRDTFTAAWQAMGRPLTDKEFARRNTLTGRVYASANRTHMIPEEDMRMAVNNGLPVYAPATVDNFARDPWKKYIADASRARPLDGRVTKALGEDPSAPRGNAYGEMPQGRGAFHGTLI